MAGLTTADLATLAIGPVTPVYPSLIQSTFESDDSYGIDAMAIPDFIAGLIYGFTGDNQLEEIESCYHGSQDVVTYAEALYDDLSHGNWIKAIDDNAKFATALDDALHTCTDLDDDLARIQAWGEIFTEPVQLTETVTKNWILHKRHIKKEWAQEQLDWANGDYFNAGVDTADCLVSLVGPVP